MFNGGRRVGYSGGFLRKGSDQVAQRYENALSQALSGISNDGALVLGSGGQSIGQVVSHGHYKYLSRKL